jgi:hypothetical protein
MQSVFHSAAHLSQHRTRYLGYVTKHNTYFCCEKSVNDRKCFTRVNAEGKRGYELSCNDMNYKRKISESVYCKTRFYVTPSLLRKKKRYPEHLISSYTSIVSRRTRLKIKVKKM